MRGLGKSFPSSWGSIYGTPVDLDMGQFLGTPHTIPSTRYAVDLSEHQMDGQGDTSLCSVVLGPQIDISSSENMSNTKSPDSKL